MIFCKVESLPTWGGENYLCGGVDLMSNCCGNNTREINLKVKGMSCGHCKMAIEKAVNSLDGIKYVEVNLEDGLVKVKFDFSVIDEEKIQNAIKEEGYSVV